jgi:hypothetical protein
MAPSNHHLNQQPRPKETAMRKFLFDVKLFASITIEAQSGAEARSMLKAELDCASGNLGAWPNGQPILCEVSMDGEADLCDEVSDEIEFDPENIYNLPSIRQSIEEDRR